MFSGGTDEIEGARDVGGSYEIEGVRHIDGIAPFGVKTGDTHRDIKETLL